MKNIFILLISTYIDYCRKENSYITLMSMLLLTITLAAVSLLMLTAALSAEVRFALQLYIG